MKPLFSLANIFTEFKYSLRLALPLGAAEIIYALNGFSATLMVAKLGKLALAANALTWGIFVALLVFFIGVLASVSIMVAHSFGAKDERGIAICFQQGLIMAIISALPMMLVMWLSSIILSWTGQDPEVIKVAKPLFHAFTLVMLPLNMMFVIEQFLVGINKTRLVMLMSVFQVPLSIFFYYVFIFGNWGFPKLGLVGIAWGLALADTTIAILLILYLKSSKQFKHYGLFDKWWVVNKKFLFEMFRIGIPLGFVYCIEVALFAAVAIMMGALSTNTLAAYQIAHQFWTIPLCTTFALSQTATIRAGHEVGRNNRDALKLAAAVNIVFSLLIMLIFSIFYINFANFAVSLDINSSATQLQAVAQEAIVFLPIVGIIILFDCLRLVSFGVLRGIKDTKFPLIISIIGFWCIAFPVAYLLAFKFKLGAFGIWWGIWLGILIAGIMLLVRLYRLVNRVDLQALVTRSS